MEEYSNFAVYLTKEEKKDLKLLAIKKNKTLKEMCAKIINELLDGVIEKKEIDLFHVLVPSDLLHAFKKIAKQNRQTMGELFRRKLNMYIEYDKF